MWYKKSTDEVLSEFNTDRLLGLSSEDVIKKREKYGENKLATMGKKTLLSLIFDQLNDILIYILLGAGVVSAIVGETADAIIIGIVIILNAIIGIIQESKAEKALDALKKLSTPKAVVKRDGELKEIPSEEIVPGDLIIIDAGRFIPCDIRLIESANLKIEESTLTGESVPVDKNANLKVSDDTLPLGDQKNMAFMSTLSTYGRGIGVAVETGMNTEIGKIAKMLDTNERELTPLQKKLAELGKYLGYGALFICTVIFFVGILQKRDVFEMLLTSISLAVAAIPEGLPAIVTIVLAVGVQKMIKENAIIRKLPAVETLGAVNVICSDKTGTLTQNKMTIIKFYCDDFYGNIENLDINNPLQRHLLENIVLCNDATFSETSKTGDPTEIALLEAGVKYNIIKDRLQKEHERVNEIPFDSDRKLMTTVNRYGENYHVFTKGATDNLLKLCNYISIQDKITPLNDEMKNKIMNSANSMSDEALRVLGAAYKIIPSVHIEVDNLENDLIFLGLVGMIDPPRLEVKDSIALCKKSGIKTIMITGDHKNTAFAIAKELGIAEKESEAIFGAEIDSMSDDELAKNINNIKVFARVSPEHKVRIVKAFKMNGNIVSMTGDGVNDAPSLKVADIGVAMGITGTDVAKGAADMILTDDNFSTIVKAIEEGRNIFNNIKKSILFLLSCNIGEIITLFLAILLGWPAPLRPIHILWVNLITDSLPALSLGVDPGSKDVMNEKPRNSRESLFANGMGLNMVFNGLLIGLLSLAAFIIGAKMYSNSTSLFPLIPKNMSKEVLTHAQTMAFVVLSISQLVHSLNMRHRKHSIFKLGLFTNKYLIGSIIIGVFLQFIIISVPMLASIFSVYSLNLLDISIVIGLSLMPLLVNEIIKAFKK